MLTLNNNLTLSNHGTNTCKNEKLPIKNKFLTGSCQEFPFIKFTKMKKNLYISKAHEKLNLQKCLKLINSKEAIKHTNTVPDLYLSNFPNKIVNDKFKVNSKENLLCSNLKTLNKIRSENLSTPNENTFNDININKKDNIKVLHFKKSEDLQKSNKTVKTDKSSDMMHLQKSDHKSLFKPNFFFNSSHTFISPSNRFNNPKSNSNAAINANYDSSNYFSLNGTKMGLSVFGNSNNIKNNNCTTRLNIGNNNFTTNYSKFKNSSSKENSNRKSEARSIFSGFKKQGRNFGLHLNYLDYDYSTFKNVETVPDEEILNNSNTFKISNKNLMFNNTVCNSNVNVNNNSDITIKNKKQHEKKINLIDYDQFELYKDRYFKMREEQMLRDAAYFIYDKSNTKKFKKYAFKEIDSNEHFEKIVDKITRLVEIKKNNNDLVSVEFIVNMLKAEIEQNKIQPVKLKSEELYLPLLCNKINNMDEKQLKKPKKYINNNTKENINPCSITEEMDIYWTKQNVKHDESSKLINYILKSDENYKKNKRSKSTNDKENSLSEYSVTRSVQSCKKKKTKKKMNPPRTGNLGLKLLGKLEGENLEEIKFLNTQKNFFMKKLDSFLITQSSGFSGLENNMLRKTLSLFKKNNKNKNSFDLNTNNTENLTFNKVTIKSIENHLMKNYEKNLNDLSSPNNISDKVEKKALENNLITYSDDTTDLLASSRNLSTHKSLKKAKEKNENNILISSSNNIINTINTLNSYSNNSKSIKPTKSKVLKDSKNNRKRINLKDLKKEKSVFSAVDTKDKTNTAQTTLNNEDNYNNNSNGLTTIKPFSLNEKTLSNQNYDSENLNTLSGFEYLDTNQKQKKTIRIKVKQEKANETDDSVYEEMEVTDHENEDIYNETQSKEQKDTENNHIPKEEDIEIAGINSFKKFMLENLLDNNINEKTLKWLETMNSKDDQEEEEYAYVDGKRYKKRKRVYNLNEAGIIQADTCYEMMLPDDSYEEVEEVEEVYNSETGSIELKKVKKMRRREKNKKEDNASNQSSEDNEKYKKAMNDAVVKTSSQLEYLLKLIEEEERIKPVRETENQNLNHRPFRIVKTKKIEIDPLNTESQCCSTDQVGGIVELDEEYEENLTSETTESEHERRREIIRIEREKKEQIKKKINEAYMFGISQNMNFLRSQGFNEAEMHRYEDLLEKIDSLKNLDPNTYMENIKILLEEFKNEEKDILEMRNVEKRINKFKYDLGDDRYRYSLARETKLATTSDLNKNMIFQRRITKL